MEPVVVKMLLAWTLLMVLCLAAVLACAWAGWRVFKRTQEGEKP